MTDVRVDMTISLDGFICGLEAQKPPYLDDRFFRIVRWITNNAVWQERYGMTDETTPDPATDPVTELITERERETGAYVLGRRMYDSAGGAWDEEAPYHVPTFIVTHREHEPVALADGTTFHFVTDGFEAAIEQAKAAAGDRKVHVSGGADIVQQAFAAGLVDELHIHIAPVLLGQGTRLFDNLPDRMVELDRFRTVDSADATHLGFRVVKEGN